MGEGIDSMTVGFLLGAGFSKALHSSMPIVTELLRQIDMPSDVPQAICGDLEQILSYLWTNYPWNTEAQHLKNKYHFLDLSQQIYKVITEAESQAWSELYNDDPLRIVSNRYNANSKVIWQAKLAGLLSDHDRFFAITMNYDTLLERLMMMNQNSNLVYPAPLQRLNGIWNQLEPYFSDLNSNVRGLFDFIVTQQPLLYKLHGSVSWYSLDPLEANAPIYCVQMNKDYTIGKHVVTQEIDDALTSIIVPPVADKSSLYNNKVLRSQWIGASQSLQKCETLYCVGYSFPQSDLSMRLFMAQACRNLKKVILVDPIAEQLRMKVEGLFPIGNKFELIDGHNCVEKMALRLFEENESTMP